LPSLVNRCSKSTINSIILSVKVPSLILVLVAIEFLVASKISENVVELFSALIFV